MRYQQEIVDPRSYVVSRPLYHRYNKHYLLIIIPAG